VVSTSFTAIEYNKYSLESARRDPQTPYSSRDLIIRKSNRTRFEKLASILKLWRKHSNLTGTCIIYSENCTFLIDGAFSLQKKSKKYTHVSEVSRLGYTALDRLKLFFVRRTAASSEAFGNADVASCAHNIFRWLCARPELRRLAGGGSCALFVSLFVSSAGFACGRPDLLSVFRASRLSFRAACL
jgi:hypothetical protein